MSRNRPRRTLAWLLCLMLLAFLVCSIGLAHAEPDTTSSTNPQSDDHAPSDLDVAGHTGPDRDRAADDRDDIGHSGDRNDDRDGDDDRDGERDDARFDDDDNDNDNGDARLRLGVARGDDLPRTSGSDDGSATSSGDELHLVDTDAVATDGLDDAHVDDPAPASIEAASHVPTWAHGVDAREAALRRHAPWFGRLDISITWRRALNDSTHVQRDEVWVVGTWRL